LPIYKECILNGPPDLRESGANGLNEAINLSEYDAKKENRFPLSYFHVFLYLVLKP